MEVQECVCPHDYKSLKRHISNVKERVTEIIRREPQTASYIFNCFLLVERILVHIDHALDNNSREQSIEAIFNTKANIQRHSSCTAIKHRRKFKKK